MMKLGIRIFSIAVRIRVTGWKTRENRVDILFNTVLFLFFSRYIKSFTIQGVKMAEKRTKNKSGFKREAWFTRQVAERTVLALKRQNEEFAKNNETATDEELINYVIRCARDCRKSPAATEIIGGKYIARRFGSWNAVLYRAGLPRCGMAPKLENRRIYKREFKIQADLFREERRIHKIEKEAAAKDKREAKRYKDIQEKPADAVYRDGKSD